MRAHLLPAGLLVALACHRPAAVDPGGPVVAPGYAGPVVDALEGSPAPTPRSPASPRIYEPPPVSPPPTWEWAISVLPPLAEHTEVDPGPAALERFVGWFSDGGSPRVHFLHDGTCHVVEGSTSAEGFFGRWHEEITFEGKQRTVSGLSLEIGLGGVTESGPGGVIQERDAQGHWQEVGGFGVGSFGTLVDHPMSAADERAVTFAGYTYGLEPICDRTEAVTQTCQGGGERRCERCVSVWLRPKLERMGSGRGGIGIGHSEPTPVDCTQPCPADAWTPRLPGLAAVLEGRTFHGVLAGEGPVVFRSAKGCARELRRRRASAAAGEAPDSPSM